MNVFGFRSDTNLYFGRVSIRVMILVACGLMVLTQLFMSIWFLAYHDWWWFITLACVLAGNGLLLLSIKFRNPDFIRIVIIYQILYVILCMGTIVFMVLLVCHPHSDTPFFRNCMDIRNHGKDKAQKPYKYSIEDCTKKTRVLGGVFAGIYTIIALVNLVCATVVYNYFKYIVETGPIRSKPITTRAAPQPVASSFPAPISDALPSSGTTQGTDGRLPPPNSTAAMRSSSTVSLDSRPVFTLTPPSDNSSRQASINYQRDCSQESIVPDWDAAPSYNPYEQPRYKGDNQAPPPVPSHYGKNYNAQY